MNVGSSAQGREFAARNCDFLFTVIIDTCGGADVVRAYQARAREFHRRALILFTTTTVVCRPSTREAQAYHHSTMRLIMPLSRWWSG